MGRVGQHLVSYLLKRPECKVYFYPWENDYLAGSWPEEINRVVITDPTGLEIDQCISFCSVVDWRQDRYAKLTTPWIYYELSTLPREFADGINTNDAVYVPSSFVRRVFSEQGVVIPITLMGHGFDPNYYRFFQRERGEVFVFLCVAEHTSRKNLPMLLRCFQRTFAREPDVRLVLKLGLQGEGDLRSQITQPGKVKLLTEPIQDDAGLAELYRGAHCFVLPTRAEGFGMPILEAMATGLPVIVTDYGGYLDFCNKDNSFLIRNKGMVDSDPACFPGFQSQWADPDEEHLSWLLRQVYEDYEGALVVGRKGFMTVRYDWTWAKQLAKLLP